MANVDIARALKDKHYFNSLSEEEKALVRAANPAGEATLDDSELDTVSGGLGGGEELMATTTSTRVSCSCPANSSSLSSIPPDDQLPAPTEPAPGGCACNCS